MVDRYRPVDELFLWWLAAPERPRHIGRLQLLQSTRGVSLTYADEWVRGGVSLSEDLPLTAGLEFIPDERDSAAGAVDDARPDRWGERVIRFVDRPDRLSLMEYLYFAGDERFGALGVSVSGERYLPRRHGPLPTLQDTDAVHELVRKVLENEPIEESLKRLISPGGTMGGARPKAVLTHEGESWIVKFSDGDPIDVPLVEHATLTLAQQANIRVAESHPIRLRHGHAVRVRRFDRQQGRRVHSLSAQVALRAAGEVMGYPELAQLLRRKGSPDAHPMEMAELFRRMVFNVLVDNTDDHEKNHALCVNDAAQYQLAPAYDVLPSSQGLGFQQMRIGTDGADATLKNCLSESGQFLMSRSEAEEQVREVAQVVNRWREHFRQMGVTDGDIELLSEHIDRPFLRDQRNA